MLGTPLETLLSPLKEANLLLRESLAMLSGEEVEYLEEKIPRLITEAQIE